LGRYAEEEAMTEDEERKFSLMRNPRHAWALWDAHDVNDVNGAVNIQRRIRRVEEQLHELGVGKAEFVAYCLREDERGRAARKLRAIEAYEKTGVIT
jgi:hypothetical protein